MSAVCVCVCVFDLSFGTFLFDLYMLVTVITTNTITNITINTTTTTVLFADDHFATTNLAKLLIRLINQCISLCRLDPSPYQKIITINFISSSSFFDFTAIIIATNLCRSVILARKFELNNKWRCWSRRPTHKWNLALMGREREREREYLNKKLVYKCAGRKAFLVSFL